jgi:hypothetical protein
MTDWTAIVREAEADLDAAGRDVEIAHAEVEEAQAAYQVALDRQAQMRSTVEWARRKQEADQPASEAELASRAAAMLEPEARPTDAEGAKTLVKRCTDALERFGRPVKTAEVRDSINREGHNFSTSQIGSTLKYLSSDRRKDAPVVAVGDGVWRLARPPADVESSSPRGHDDPILNGARGRP